MTHDLKLKATAREERGKSAHKLAPEGLLPAVVYGPKIETMSLTVNRRDFEHLLHSAAVGSTLIDLTVEGGKAIDVIIKEVRREPLKGTLLHVDFWAVDMGHTLQTVVPILFTGSAEGERAGGVVMHAMREIKVEARPSDLPEHVEADISALGVGDSLTVGQLPATKGVTLLDDPETVVASVTPPTVEAEPELEEGEVPEVGKETEAEAGE